MNGAQLLAVAAGGALGAAGRYVLVDACARVFGRGFPWGTLAVNVTGCVLMGLAITVAIERAALPEPWRAAAVVGVLGGFTTFSAFAGDTLMLVEQQRFALAGVNVLAQLLLCAAAVALGAAAGRML